MANNTLNNVVVGKPSVTGGAYTAPLGTAVPTDALTALVAAYTAVGYLTDAGVTKSEKRNSGIVTAWGGDTVAITNKGREVTAKLQLAELLTANAQTAIYGSANVVVTAATSTSDTKLKVTGTSAPAPSLVWCFEIVNDAKKVRLVFPNARVTDQGDLVFKDDAVAANDITLTCLPDSSGAYFYMLTDDGVHL